MNSNAVGPCTRRRKLRIEKPCDPVDVDDAKRAIDDYCGSIGHEYASDTESQVRQPSAWSLLPAFLALLVGDVLLASAGMWLHVPPRHYLAADDGGALLFILVIFGLPVLAIWAAIKKQARLKQARADYATALSLLGRNPESNAKRIAALEAGRQYADLARRQPGSKGRAIFDEVALQNDITARLGSPVPARSDERRRSKCKKRPKPTPEPEIRHVERTIERQVVVTRCKFCQHLTPVDLEHCKNCGAAKFV